MSIVLGKREHLNTSNESFSKNDSKRFRTTESSRDREFIIFSSTDYQENLKKLSLLFPSMENQILSENLKKTNNSLEDTISLLKNPQVNSNDLSRHYANYLITNLQSAPREKALEIATNIFSQFYEAIRISKTDSVMHNNFKVEDMNCPMEVVQEFVEERPDHEDFRENNLCYKERNQFMLKKLDNSSQGIFDEDLREKLELKSEIQQLNKANNMLRMHLQTRLQGANFGQNE